jgi:hypothetical protein
VPRRRVGVKTGYRQTKPKATARIEKIAPQNKTWLAKDRQPNNKNHEIKRFGQ